jgi:hypothetical protein
VKARQEVPGTRDVLLCGAGCGVYFVIVWYDALDKSILVRTSVKYVSRKRRMISCPVKENTAR